MYVFFFTYQSMDQSFVKRDNNNSAPLMNGDEISRFINNLEEDSETSMTIAEAQRRVDCWMREVGGKYFSHLTNMALLSEEVGELARLIARIYGEQRAKPGDLRKSLAEEMADIIWVVICLANESGIDLTEAFRQSIKKKWNRDARRFL